VSLSRLKEGTKRIYTNLMETMKPIKIAEVKGFCEELTPEQEELGRELFERIAGKWPLWVLYVLMEADAPLRFSRVHERVEGISQKVLTQTLRHLERDGLITRTLYPQVPPRVDYALTLLGSELLLQLMPLGRWITDRIAHFEAARHAFDHQKADKA
jgi:DNA-binding HxlR family transcriptional regulator